jgi:hypothetical protein
MDGLVSGLYKPGDVRDFLDRYHDEDTPPMPAHQYLGMTVDEYRSWKVGRAAGSIGRTPSAGGWA